jgi:hypothetical protein
LLLVLPSSQTPLSAFVVVKCRQFKNACRCRGKFFFKQDEDVVEEHFHADALGAAAEKEACY